MNEAAVQEKLERIEQLTTKLTELFNQVATITDEVAVLLQSVSEHPEAAQEPEQLATKENARKWYTFNLISVETMSVEDFCKHTGFLEECNRLKVSPKFKIAHIADGPRHFIPVAVCLLKDITVSEDWLMQHSVDDTYTLYYVGDLTFYIGHHLKFLGEHKC